MSPFKAPGAFPPKSMITRRRIVSILLVAVIAGGGALYAYFGTVRVLPVLLITVDIQASDPNAQRIPFILGDHCEFNYFNRWGELETRYPIPSGAVAALFLTVRSWPDGVGFIGSNPRILYMTGSSFAFPSRALPPSSLFNLELREGQFLIPGGILLKPGDSARHGATYDWNDDAGSIQVTEDFTFTSVGSTRLRRLSPALCA